MSNRHRTGQTKPAKVERRVDHHRERQATRAALALAAFDPDDIVDPRPLHSSPARKERSEPGPLEAPRRRFRHWKAPFWKRRNAMRHERNQEIALLAAD